MGTAFGAEDEPSRSVVWRVQIERTPAQQALSEMHGARLRPDPGVIDDAQLKRRWSHMLRIQLDEGESLSIRPRKGGLMLNYRVEF